MRTARDGGAGCCLGARACCSGANAGERIPALGGRIDHQIDVLVQNVALPRELLSREPDAAKVILAISIAFRD